MARDFIRYDILAQNALRGVVRNVLADTAKKGLQGEHHFYVSFDTRSEGVRISPALREKYPDEMTIVLQHQFWDLKVSDDHFEVGLSFGGVPERLFVPFSAVMSFVDPSVQFVLQFEPVKEGEEAAKPSAAKPAALKPVAPAEKPKKSGKPQRANARNAASVPSIPAAGGMPAIPAASAATTQSNQKAKKSDEKPDDKSDQPDKPKGGAQVVRLDRFRKK